MTLPCMFSCKASVPVSLCHREVPGTRQDASPSSVETQSVRPLALSLSVGAPPLLILTILTLLVHFFPSEEFVSRACDCAILSLT